MLHFSYSMSVPVHRVPPTHVLILDRVPPLHVLLQLDHEDQVDHVPSLPAVNKILKSLYIVYNSIILSYKNNKLLFIMMLTTCDMFYI